DLKPSNVLLCGDEPEPLVCDFGLAARLDGRPGPPCFAGTPPYAAPEQCDGHDLTPAADVWSLGVVLHELLTGRQASASVGLGETGREGICRRCLRRDPAERSPDAADLADDLRRICDL